MVTEMIVIGFMTKKGHMVKIGLMIGIIRIFEAEASLEMVEIEMTEEFLGIEKGHMTEVEIETIKEDLIETEVGRIQDPVVEENQPLKTKVKKGGVTIAEKWDILRECQKRKKDKDKEGEHKVQIQQIAEVTEENWLNSLPSTTLEGVNDKEDMIVAYGMMKGAWEKENDDKTLNI